MSAVPSTSFLILLVLFAGESLAGAIGGDTLTERRVGHAFGLGDGVPAYTEEHEERIALGRVRSLKTLYKDAQGKIETRYDSRTRRMKEYRGLSNRAGPGGKSRKIRLEYEEPGL